MKRRIELAGIVTGMTLVVAACGSGSSNETVAAPDNSTEAGITAMLEAEDAEAAKAGFVPDPDEPIVVRALGIDGDIDELATFEVGSKYRLIGICGKGCEEIGIIASGSHPSGSGQNIHAESAEGAGTRVQVDFTPNTAPGRLTLTMWKCSAQPCLAGIRLYKAKKA